MAMILENNDLAAPILILQLLRAAVVLGSIEFIAGLLEGLDRNELDNSERQSYMDAMKELNGDVRNPSDELALNKVSIKILIMFNCELLHLAARVSCLTSIKCLLSLGAEAFWSNSTGKAAVRCVGITENDESLQYKTRHTTTHKTDSEIIEENACRIILLKSTPRDHKQSLEQIAVENGEDSVELIEAYYECGTLPLVANSRKLYPYHFARTPEVFATLTKPPVEPRALLLTLGSYSLLYFIKRFTRSHQSQKLLK